MRTIVFIFSLVLFIGCGKKKKSDYSKKGIIKEVKVNEGKKLLKEKCYLCHNPTQGKSGRIGPPMIAIKAYYINDTITKEQFTNDLLAFLKKPTKENAKMLDDVKRYGLMPYQHFEEEDVKKIASYIFDFQIQEPSWFKGYWKEKNNTPYKNNNK